MARPLESIAGSKEIAKHTNEKKQRKKGEGLQIESDMEEQSHNQVAKQ